MLELSNPRWESMRRCGDYSTVVPALLRRMESPAHFMDARGAFDSLRLALIACGSVDEVAYATVPHLARLNSVGDPPSWEYIDLIAQVEIHRICWRSPPVPEDLAPAYFQTLRDLPRLIAACDSAGLSDQAVAALAGALVVSFGRHRFGAAIMELGSQRHREDQTACPARCDDPESAEAGETG